jgi:AcrR family transcriptional regulator
MAIYHHFASREALLNAVTDREFAKLLSYMQAHPLNGHIEDRLLAVMAGYVDYAFAQPRIFDFVFSRPHPGARQFPKDFRARRSPTLNPVADALAAEMKQVLLKKDDVWEVAFALWAHVHGDVMLYRAGRIAVSEKDFRKLLYRSMRRFPAWTRSLRGRAMRRLSKDRLGVNFKLTPTGSCREGVFQTQKCYLPNG